MQEVRHSVTIAGQRVDLSSRALVAAMERAEPEKLRDHFVVVEGQRYPPKQVIAAVTGIDRNDFTTNQARSILRRLGFIVGRVGVVSEPAQRYETPQHETRSEEAEKLRPFIGKWVVSKDGEVLVSGDDPIEVYRWLERNDRYGDSMFRVPVDPRFETHSWAP